MLVSTEFFDFITAMNTVATNFLCTVNYNCNLSALLSQKIAQDTKVLELWKHQAEDELFYKLIEAFVCISCKAYMKYKRRNIIGKATSSASLRQTLMK